MIKGGVRHEPMPPLSFNGRRMSGAHDVPYASGAGLFLKPATKASPVSFCDG